MVVAGPFRDLFSVNGSADWSLCDERFMKTMATAAKMARFIAQSTNRIGPRRSWAWMAGLLRGLGGGAAAGLRAADADSDAGRGDWGIGSFRRIGCGVAVAGAVGAGIFLGSRTDFLHLEQTEVPPAE